MCGVGGVMKLGESPITESQIKLLLCSLEERGNDAAGVALMEGNELHVYKIDTPAWLMVGSRVFDNFLQEYLRPTTNIALVHTRAATQGTPKENENNHPIFAGVTAVVHNGMIQNDDSLFGDMKLERKAATDSDIIRAILDKEGFERKGIRALEKMNGSCAAAAVSKDYPGQLLLLRSGGPLILAITDEDQIVFGSTRSACHEAARPWVEKYKILVRKLSTKVYFTPMPPDSAWLIGPEGLMWHQQFKSSTFYHPSNYSRVHANFNERKSKWSSKDVSKKGTTPFGLSGGGEQITFGNSGKPKTISYQCPKCLKWLPLKPEQFETPKWELSCQDCKVPLMDKPVEGEEDSSGEMQQFGFGV